MLGRNAGNALTSEKFFLMDKFPLSPDVYHRIWNDIRGNVYIKYIIIRNTEKGFCALILFRHGSAW